LNKFIHGNNIKSCTRLEIKKALKKLKWRLKLSIKNADLNRIDIGGTFIMDFEPPLYHLKLSEVRRYKKSMLKNHETLYFEVNKNGLGQDRACPTNDPPSVQSFLGPRKVHHF